MSAKEPGPPQKDGDASKPISKYYIFERLISVGPITQSWAARNAATGERSFIKASIPSVSIDDNSISSILSKSFELQKLLRCNDILKARRKIVEKGRIFIEYPYLDQEKWQSLTLEFLERHFSLAFIQICKTIDYLHLLGLVHCDLKFENFSVNTFGSIPRVILLDLDFLSSDDSNPESRIFGSYDSIPPEIRENNVVLVQSDNFSIGQALKNFSTYLRSESELSDAIPHITQDKILQLADELTTPDPIQRPKFLLEALFKHELLQESEYRSTEKSILGLKLLSDFKSSRNRGPKYEQTFKNLLSPQNRIFGVPAELSEDLASLYILDPLKALRLCRSLIENATLDRYDIYWQISLNDKELARIFKAIEEVAAGNGFRIFRELPEAGPRLDDYCREILKYSEEGGKLKSFMALKRILEYIKEDPTLSDDSILNKILRKTGDFAQTLGRTKEAIAYLSPALDGGILSIEERSQILYDIGHNFLLSGMFNESEEWILKGKEVSKNINDRKDYRAFIREEAWLLISRGKYDAANEILGSLIDEARNLCLADELGSSLITQGILYWRQGEYLQAEKALLESLANVEKARNIQNQIAAMSNLSLLYYEFAEYRKAISYGEKAYKLAEDINQTSRLSSIYLNLVICHNRLAEYRKAEDWLHRYLSCQPVRHDINFFRRYYFYWGGLLLRRCRLRQANEKLNLALELQSAGRRDQVIGQILQCLALVALYKGDDTQFDVYASKAGDEFSYFKDKVSSIEISFLRNLQALHYSPDHPVAPLLRDLDQLVKHNSRRYAGLCLFHILIYADEEIRRDILSKHDAFIRFAARSDAPFFQATSTICDGIKILGNEKSGILPNLKTAYRTLLNSEDRFLAMCVCRQIGEVYVSISQFKLAGKFLNQALKLAMGLDNESLSRSIREQLQSLPDQSFNRSQMLQSFRQISEILGSIDDYDEALNKLVGYAISETGAERGAILLSSDDQSRLAVKSFVNCDPECLEDIRQFSQSVCRLVSQEMTPLIIDNAKEDDRTKKYKSIIAYNILSVVCLPIKIEGKLTGVIYLDHHTIPALFDHDDITFIYSIANFISVLLSAIRRQKYQKETQLQLIDDLARLGNTPKFVTQNSMMQQMLSRLPEIARHSVNILLLGESGTGKEILAQMVHDMSLRSKGPLVKLNCAAIAGSLIESELFGVAKNVATGVDEREGKLSAADGGTLFLDEIGDMPLEVQSKILRVLEDQHFEKVGSNRTIVTDIRFIYATNKDLKALMKEGKFREDLYYRINTIIIQIPPLRDRRDDVPLLLEHFLAVFVPDAKKRPIFSSSALEAMTMYAWPGNVRELKNLAEKYCLLYSGRVVDLIDLPPEFHERRDHGPEAKRSAENIEKARIRQLLISTDWNQSEVSRITGIPLSTLRRKIKKYRISRAF